MNEAAADATTGRDGTRMTGARLTAAIILAGLALGSAVQAGPPASRPEILTSDVDRFFRVYDAAGGHPTAAALQRGYVDAGTDGLHQFARLRDISGASLVAAIDQDPAPFATARRCVAVLPAVRRRLTADLATLRRRYPAARFPPVTILVGRARTGGTTSAAGVLIGLETLCHVDFLDPNLENRFVHLIAHEYVHVQQPGAEEADDKQGSVLFASLIEGGAEFIGEMISGAVGNYQMKDWTRGREREIETAFVPAAGTSDFKPWLYNGPGSKAHPSDLGYWVGYRITKSYYVHARDKRRAIRDILTVTQDNADAFFARSGWSPGMALPDRVQ